MGSTVHSCDTHPLISIITVVYNIVEAGRCDSFIRLVESVQSQSDGMQVEHIVIDGGSTDGTADCIARYADAGYFAYWISEPDTGIYNAMNKGSRAARGDYLLYVNSDDYMLPDAVTTIARAVQKSASDYYIADTCVVDVHGDHSNTTHTLWRASLKRALVGQLCCHQGLVIRKNVFMDLGMYDERYRIASDVHLTMGLYMKGYSYAAIHSPIVAFSTGGISGTRYKTLGETERIDIYMQYYGDGLGLTRDEVSLLIATDAREWFFSHKRKTCATIIKKLQRAQNTKLAQAVYAAMLLHMFDDESGRYAESASLGYSFDQPLVRATLLPKKRKYAFLLAYIAKKLHVYGLIKPFRDSIVRYFEKKKNRKK